MKRSSYRERDYPFGRTMLTLRMRIGLTQAELAKRLNISRKAVGEWEAGITYPKNEHLKALIALSVQQRVFSAGHEEEEIRALWNSAHQKLPLDDALLSPYVPATNSISAPSEYRNTRMDWDNAPAFSTFYGREREAALLSSWIIKERCRVIALLGLGGIGKSVLSTRVMQRAAKHFAVVIWRSLRDAPTCEALLDDCLQILAPHLLDSVATGLEQRMNVLLEYLRHTRVLLVLDNLEVLLEEGQSTGRMQAGYEGYARLLRRLAETEHQGCLLLTSREKPGDLVPFEGSQAPVRVLRLERLDSVSCKQLLAEKGITGAAAEQDRLIDIYAGNPLALRIVAQTIIDLFAGQIAPFLHQDAIVFGGVRELLNEQYVRLSASEQSVLLWLAILREAVGIEEVLTVVANTYSRASLLEAVDSLRRRSLIEPGQSERSFTLQSVVLEYVTTRLISEMGDEIEQRRPVHLIEHALELATVKEYIRQTQHRLIVHPLLMRLQKKYPVREILGMHLLTFLDDIRARTENAQGYAPTNLLMLLYEQRGHLNGLDLSRLSIRAAALQGIEIQDTTLAFATVRDTTFTEALAATRAVAVDRIRGDFAAGSWRGKVRIWRQGGALLHRSWQAHTSTVSTLAFSPDGETLATGSWDGTIKLWNVASGILLWTNWRPNNVQTLAFAPDGRMIASGGNDAQVQLWDAATGKYLRSLGGQKGAVYALAWSPDGCLLVSGGLDGAIRLWRLHDAQPEDAVHVFQDHTDWVFTLAWSPGGNMLASGSFDCTVKLWKLEDNDQLHVRETFNEHTDKLRAVAWSIDGSMLASGGFDRTIWLRKITENNYLLALQGHSAAVHGLAFTPDGHSLLSGSDDNTLHVWDVAGGRSIRILQGYALALYDVAWSPDGTRLASAGSNALVTIWETDEQERTRSRQLHGHHWNVYGVAWSPDGHYLASCGWDNMVYVWQTSTGAIRQRLQDSTHVDTIFYGVTWSPDGHYLAAASYQHGVHVWDATTGTCLWVSETPPAIMRRVEWSPDGTQLASCCDDGHIYLWNATDGRICRSLRGNSTMVEVLAWSPDGMKLASGGGSQNNGELFIWDVATGKYTYSVTAPAGHIYALAWDSSGAFLVSGGADGILRRWNVTLGSCIQGWKAHQGTVQSLKVSPDGTQLASCGDDGAIMRWNMNSGEYLGMLRHDRPYERLMITGIQGLSETQKSALYALGAIEQDI